jgi:hypothetical protein
MTQHFHLPATGALKKAIGRDAVTHIHLYDSCGALADAALASKGMESDADDWKGGLTAAEAVRRSHSGDMARVAPSDALLARFERFGFASPRRVWTNDVTGALPDVQAYLAGHPLAMRRRAKVTDTASPLAIIVDLSSSQGVRVPALEKRGAAILALVRIMSARRPVELWAGCALDANGGKNASVCLARIDTAPLDLARAAFVLVGASFPRHICYGLGKGLDGFSGGWPYGSHTISRTMLRDMIAPAFPHVSDMLCVPAAHVDDKIHNDPEAWIESRLADLEVKAEAEAA